MSGSRGKVRRHTDGLRVSVGLASGGWEDTCKAGCVRREEGEMVDEIVMILKWGKVDYAMQRSIVLGSAEMVGRVTLARRN